MGLMREPGWEGRFASYISSQYSETFSMEGRHCGAFCLGGVRAVLGENTPPAAYLLEGTADEVVAKIAAAGYTSPVQFLASQFPRTTVLMARAGDVLVARASDDQLWAFGLCQGVGAYFLSPQGMVYAPRDRATLAFKVGD